MTEGVRRFARYAAAPNALRYCGPDEQIGQALGEDVDADDLRGLALHFEGAWPYLTLIAAELGFADPLHDGVVKAYWEGSPLLPDVDGTLLASMTEQTHGHRAGKTPLPTALVRQALPHHSFHVYCVYPWVGLLRAGVAEPSLRILDQCRVSVAVVAGLDPLHVTRRPLRLEAGLLGVGAPTIERVRPCPDHAIRPSRGDLVTVHWGWICGVLDNGRAQLLESVDAFHRRLANQTLSPGLQRITA